MYERILFIESIVLGSWWVIIFFYSLCDKMETGGRSKKDHPLISAAKDHWNKMYEEGKQREKLAIAKKAEVHWFFDAME